MTKRQLDPDWTDAEKREGERLRRAWEAHFSAAEKGTAAASAPGSANLEGTEIDAIIERHQTGLLSLANVVAIARGIRMKGGLPNGESCITVYVDRKIPKGQLDDRDILPKEIEGIPVDVVEAGEIEAL